MSQNRKVKQRAYYRRIYLWITLSSLLPLTIFAIIAYYNVQQAVLFNEYQANKKILLQIKFNIDYMNETILNSVLSLYYSTDVNTIMYNRDADLATTLDAMNKIKGTTMNTNPFIHSIYIYNNNTKIFYTTLENMYFQDKNLNRLLQQKEMPTLKPIPRKIEYNLVGNNNREENVITYFMYDFKDADNRMTGGLIVNGSTEWLLKNINSINMVDRKKHDKIMILDDKGEVVGNHPDDEAFNRELREAYQLALDTKNEPTNLTDRTVFFTEKVAGSKYLITYSPVEKMNWTLVKAQLYDEVFQKIDTLKITFLLITLVFLLLAVLGSLTISRRIYRPIGYLVQQVISTNQELDPRRSKDEISYLNEAYKYSTDQLLQYKTRSNSEREIRKTYFLRKLLIDSTSVSMAEFQKMFQDKELTITPDKPMMICIVKIDNLREFEQKNSSFDKGLLKFGIMNISSEILSSEHQNEAVEMKHDYIVLLLNIVKQNNVNYGQLTHLWKQAQEYIGRYYHITISVTMSDKLDDYKLLSEGHNQALDHSMYRLVYGKVCILNPLMLQSNQQNTQLGYSAMLEKRLLESLKSGSISTFEEILVRIFGEIASFSYNNILLSVMQLINTLSSTFNEINRSKIEPVHVNFNLVAQRLFELETLQELFEEILQICREAMTKTGKLENEKQSILIEAVKELVHADYKNIDLCLSFIAERLNLSAKHVSKVFGGQMNMSVSDYISEVRLVKAAEWLQSSNLSIKEILFKIGIENESYFYKLFKKKYGITPKEFALNRAVQQIQNKI